jgi:phosphonatase-like hydrolase
MGRMMHNELQYDLVVFDMAGTTVHDGDAVHHSLMAALQGVAGHAASREAVNAVMGIAKPTAIRGLLSQRGGPTPDEALVDRVHADFVRRMLAFYRTDPAVREIDGASDLFRALRAAGVKVALDTGFDRDIAQVVIDRLGWERDGLVDATVTADEVPEGRPAPHMIAKLMRMTGVTDPARVVKVGDTPSDLHEGTNAGCGMVVGVTEGSHTADELRDHPHTHLIGSIRELPELLSPVPQLERAEA